MRSHGIDNGHASNSRVLGFRLNLVLCHARRVLRAVENDFAVELEGIDTRPNRREQQKHTFV